jgi:hypothetical protein
MEAERKATAEYSRVFKKMEWYRGCDSKIHLPQKDKDIEEFLKTYSEFITAKTKLNLFRDLLRGLS